jgi:hypothetical protein
MSDEIISVDKTRLKKDLTGQNMVIKQLKNQEKHSPIVSKQYYDVKIECMLPATITYRVLAEDPQQAAELIKGMSPIGVKHRLIGRKELKLTVYDAGSTMIRWMRNLIGV